MRSGWRLGVALAVSVLLAAACGGSSNASAPSPSPQPVATTPQPSPTPTPPGLTFKLNPAQGVQSNASGTIRVTTDAGKTTFEIVIKGLQGGSSHVSHVHLGSCEQPGSILFALNQVVADSQGNADVSTTVQQSIPTSGAGWYIVVHQGPDMQGTNATYLMCGNLH